MGDAMLQKIVSILTVLSLSLFAAPQILEVTVDPGMLHTAGGTIFGKVTYKLDADQCDSVVVSMQILPAAGGEPVALASVEGDIGAIHVLPNTADREVWLTYSGPVDGQYIARITAVAVVSPEMAAAIEITEANTWTLW